MKKNRKVLRRAAVPAAVLILYFFFCLIARPGLMHGFYASGRYGEEVFFYNVTSPWCLPGQKDVTRLAGQQIDALYVQAAPYDHNASKSLIRLTAFKSISDSRLSEKAALYTEMLSSCLQDLETCRQARSLYEEGKYIDALLTLRGVQEESLVMSDADDIRYDCYDALTEDISSPETMEDYEEALSVLDDCLTDLGEDQTLQWTRDETARKYENLILAQAEEMAGEGNYEDAQALLARALEYDDSDTLRSIHESINGRQEEDLIIASSWSAFRTGSPDKAREIVQQGLDRFPESGRLKAVQDCYSSYKEKSFLELIDDPRDGMLREHFNMPDGSRLDDCLVFSKFSEATPEEELTVHGDPDSSYQMLEGTVYAGKYLDADGRLEIYGDDTLLYDSGRIYRPGDDQKDPGLHFSVYTSGIKRITLRAYVYTQPSLPEAVAGAPDREKLCTLVLDDLVFHDVLTEEMIWDAASLP